MNSWFERFARKENLTDAALCEVVSLAEKGAIDADLGEYVIKQRLSRSGAGKSGGYRTVVLYRKAQRAFFVYGFAKSERANIDHNELRAFRKMAVHVLNLSDAELAELMTLQKFKEIKLDDERSIQE